MRLDARFRGHDGGQTTYFFYELPGQEPGKTRLTLGFLRW